MRPESVIRRQSLLRQSLVLLALVASACARPAARTAPVTPTTPPDSAPAFTGTLDVPVDASFQRAIANGTRTATGQPGPNYWQQWARYDLTLRLFPDMRRVDGTGRIVYLNRSPDTLRTINLYLDLNIHAPDAPSNEPNEVTGGVTLQRVVAGGRTLSTGASGARYTVNGTVLSIVPPAPVAPGDSIPLEMAWQFRVPQVGASGRMGWSGADLYYIAYWYPRLAVYDDITGWETDPFLGRGEFYSGFASYDVTVEAPAGWVVMGTGTLDNADSVLAPTVLQRLRAAEGSDSVTRVVGESDFGLPATRGPAGARLRWRFTADSVRDVAYSFTRRSIWDATRAPIGDRNRDGQPEYTRVDAIYRTNAPRWTQAAKDAQQSITFLSRYLSVPYPWPHISAVEGEGIVGGGMEYPMMTLISAYTSESDHELYTVIAHELAHMWTPMLISTDERRYGWMDEGFASWDENMAEAAEEPGRDYTADDRALYQQFAQTGRGAPMMTLSDRQPSSTAYIIASYQKPVVVLAALRALVGDSTFARAYTAFMERWRYKQPYPRDFFNTVNDVTGRNLDWFWRTWYFETWTLDQAIADVATTAQGTTITVANRGTAPMPARLAIRLADGSTIQREVPVQTWLSGARTATVTVPAGQTVVAVTLDPAKIFPDVDRTNNIWPR